MDNKYQRMIYVLDCIIKQGDKYQTIIVPNNELPELGRIKNVLVRCEKNYLKKKMRKEKQNKEGKENNVI